MLNRLLILKRYLILAVLAILLPFSLYPQKKDPNLKEASVSYTKRLSLPAQLDESSGLMFWNNRLWSHNDSSGADSIYAFNPDNPDEIEGFYAGAPNRDWEAIGQDDDYIYIGDFGNNGNGSRDNLRIFKIEKESLLNRQPVVDTIFFAYPDQTDFTPTTKPESTDFDCEALIVTYDSIYLFTKRWLSNNTALYALPKTPGNYFAKYISTYNIRGLVTDAAYLPEKRILALSGYSSNYLRQFLYVFYDFEERDFFNGKKYNFTLNVGLFPHQIEGLATTDGKLYYATNEYKSVSPQRLHTFDVSEYFKDYMLLPETAVQIVGPINVCQEQRRVNYTIPPIQNAEVYEWKLSEGITGESNTNTITVYFDKATSGTISVVAKNKYGYGGTTNLNVRVVPKPSTPVITIAATEQKTLKSSSSTGNQWYNQYGMIPGARSQFYEVAEYGEYYVMITVDGCTSESSNIIITDKKVNLYDIPLFEPEKTSTINTEALYEYNKQHIKKKKRKFLFWYF